MPICCSCGCTWLYDCCKSNAYKKRKHFNPSRTGSEIVTRIGHLPSMPSMGRGDTEENDRVVISIVAASQPASSDTPAVTVTAEPATAHAAHTATNLTSRPATASQIVFYNPPFTEFAIAPPMPSPGSTATKSLGDIHTNDGHRHSGSIDSEASAATTRALSTTGTMSTTLTTIANSHLPVPQHTASHSNSTTPRLTTSPSPTFSQRDPSPHAGSTGSNPSDLSGYRTIGNGHFIFDFSKPCAQQPPLTPEGVPLSKYQTASHTFPSTTIQNSGGSLEGPPIILPNMLYPSSDSNDVLANDDRTSKNPDKTVDERTTALPVNKDDSVADNTANDFQSPTVKGRRFYDEVGVQLNKDSPLANSKLASLTKSMGVEGKPAIFVTNDTATAAGTATAATTAASPLPLPPPSMPMGIMPTLGNSINALVANAAGLSPKKPSTLVVYSPSTKGSAPIRRGKLSPSSTSASAATTATAASDVPTLNLASTQQPIKP